MWTSKLKAAAIHLLATLVVGGLCAILVFKIWYPDPFYRMLGGAELFLLIAASDLVLGPVISLVIYSSKKSKSVLRRDYFIIGVVQAAALAYGLHTVAVSRPIFVVFAVDGFEVVASDELQDDDLAAAPQPQWRRRSWSGPQFAWARMPADPHEKTELIFSALNGKDIQRLPKYFESLDLGREEIRSRAKDLVNLKTAHPERAAEIDDVTRRAGQSFNQMMWLPVRSFKGIWTVVLDRATLQPIAWLNLDPY